MEPRLNKAIPFTLLRPSRAFGYRYYRIGSFCCGIPKLWMIWGQISDVVVSETKARITKNMVFYIWFLILSKQENKLVTWPDQAGISRERIENMTRLAGPFVAFRMWPVQVSGKIWFYVDGFEVKYWYCFGAWVSMLHRQSMKSQHMYLLHMILWHKKNK